MKTPENKMDEIILGHLTAGGHYPLIGSPWRLPFRKLVNKNVCIKCGAKIPPGKAGRKCKSCRA